VPPALLLSFRGKAYLTGKGSVRLDLARLHNGRDVVVVLDCHLSECVHSQGANFAVMTQGVPRSLYPDLMQLSWFCLAPSGRSPASFRVLESILSGCLPVFLDEPGHGPWVPPLAEWVPWEEWMVYACYEHTSDLGCAHIPQANLGKWPTARVPLSQLVHVLRALPLHERMRRRELMLRFAYRYLRADERQTRVRHHAEIDRPLMLALRTHHDRTQGQAYGT
jgi:hypothetical protein